MLKRVPDDLSGSLYFRHETEDGQWEVGIYPVIYGFRIRAGQVGDLCYNLDMCVGDNWRMMRVLFSIVCRIIEERGCVPNNSDWPSITIKPVWKNPEYLAQLTSMMESPEKRDGYDIPDPIAIRCSRLVPTGL